MRGVAPLLTGVIAIFWMHEWPGTVGWVGMLLISLGVFALAFRPAATRPGLHGMVARSPSRWPMRVIALYTIIDGSGARLAGNAWSYIVWLFVLDAIPFTVYMLATRGPRFLSALAERRQRGLIGGGLSAGAYAISVWAMTKAPVALVASLRETSVLFATLIGARLLKEHLTPRRWPGVPRSSPASSP